MSRVTAVDFNKDVPSIVVNYYDKGPSDRRVMKAKVRNIMVRKVIIGQEYIITHTWGKDYWRQDKWGDWKLWKAT